jgi:hypothetical protein
MTGAYCACYLNGTIADSVYFYALSLEASFS